LRVLWRGKWIVLVTFLVAVGAAALVSFRAPDIFRAETVLKVERPLGLPSSYQPPSIEEVAERVQDDALLLSALGDEETVSWLQGRWTFDKEKASWFCESKPPGRLPSWLGSSDRWLKAYRTNTGEV